MNKLGTLKRRNIFRDLRFELRIGGFPFRGLHVDFLAPCTGEQFSVRDKFGFERYCAPNPT